MPVESGGRSTALALGSSFSSHTSFHLPRLTEDRKMMNPFGAPYMPHHMMRGRGSRDSDDSSDEFPIIVPTIWGPLPVKNKKSKRKGQESEEKQKVKEGQVGQQEEGRQEAEQEASQHGQLLIFFKLFLQERDSREAQGGAEGHPVPDPGSPQREAGAPHGSPP